jgi:geranylgeranyl diphosphate synthase, type II
MDTRERIENELSAMVSMSDSIAGVSAGPPLLAAAIRYAVFPGGARIRPRLCLAVADACANDQPTLADSAAAAIELLHCASLVHDDLPCFDNADLRRGKPSVHKAFGDRLAVLTGDALIVLAFEALARAGVHEAQRALRLISLVGRAIAGPQGIIAGQAWECEREIDLSEYQRAKTGALFAAATMAGAIAAGYDAAPWSLLGFRLGEAFQVADDIRDVVANPEELGKPIGQDAALGRPSAVERYGLEGAIRHLNRLVLEAVERIPVCPGAATMRALIQAETARLLPKKLTRRAA